MSANPADRGVRHWLGFIGSGAFAFLVDASVLKFLTAIAGWEKLMARLVSIAVAMVAAWLAHRTFTFAVTTPPNVMEFLRFAATAGTANALNYAIFWAVLFLRPQTDELIALVLAGGVAMVATYLGLRFAAFKPRK